MWDAARSEGFEGGYTNEPANAQSKQTSVFGSGGDMEETIVLPVTLGHIAKYTRKDNEGLVIHGKKVKPFTIVAMIAEVLDQTDMRLHLKLDDASIGSPMNAIYIKSSTLQLPFELKPGKYIRIYGNSKWQDDKVVIQAFNIAPLININEIAFHVLDVIKTFMSFEHKMPESGAKDSAQNKITPKSAITTHEDLPNLHKYLVNFIKKETERLGDSSEIYIDDICNAHRGYKKEDIVKALNQISDEGLVWNGRTQDFWCMAI